MQWLQLVLYWLFNSHPHKEDDIMGKVTRYSRCFSTHILTRRMTNLSMDLLKRMYIFNSHPHKEDDVWGIFIHRHWLFSTHILTRRMTPHSTIGWVSFIFSTHILTRRMTICFYWIVRNHNFSTHILTRRMTAILNKNTLSKTARIIPFEYNTLKIYIFSNSYLLFFWKNTPFSGANLPKDFCALIIRTKISKYP